MQISRHVLHLTDARLTQANRRAARVLKPGGVFLYDTINRNPIARFATITVAEDILQLLPKGTHDPKLFIRPAELSEVMTQAGLEVGPITGLGPRGINRRGDFTFGPLPLRSVIYMGKARKPGDRP